MIRNKVIKMSQIIGYIFKISGKSKLNRVKLIKLIWAADRYHIRNYGRLVSEDVYYAMAHGPVSSIALNIARLTEWEFEQDEYNFLDKLFNSDKKYTWIEKGANIGEDYLSETDKEALEFAWKTFGGLDDFYLADEISHQYPEWKRLEEKISNDPFTNREKIDIEDFFENPEEDAFFVVDKDHLIASKEYYKEQEKIKGILGE